MSLARTFNTLFGNSAILTSVIFQLVKVTTVIDKATGEFARDVDANPDVEETATIYLATNPSEIRYHQESRSASGLLKDGTPFLQRGGMQPGRCSLRGTMGKELRVSGLVPKSGDVRLREFREIMVKLSQAVSSRDVESGAPYENKIELNRFLSEKIGDFQGHRDTGERIIEEMFAINFYDFYNRSFHFADIKRFEIMEHVSKNDLPEYVVEMELLGPPLITQSNNFMLIGLKRAVGIFQQIEDEMASLDAALVENPYVAQTLGSLAEVAAGVDYLNGQLRNLNLAFSSSVAGVRVSDLNPLGKKISTFIGRF